MLRVVCVGISQDAGFQKRTFFSRGISITSNTTKIDTKIVQYVFYVLHNLG